MEEIVEKKEYQCEHCGKIFNSYRSLNGHKAKCIMLPKKEYTKEQLTCQFCGRVCGNKQGLVHHQDMCQLNPNKRVNDIGQSNDKINICSFCGKHCINSNSLRNHERLCKNNPNRQLTTYEKYGPTSGFNKIGTRIAWNKGLNKYTNDVIGKYALKIQQMFANGTLKFNRTIWTQEKVQQMLYNRAKNRTKSRYKFGWYDGLPCDSGWELAFVLYNKDNNKNIIRCFESFPYTIEEEHHYYTPDFIIDGVYYEIKGQDLFHTEQKIQQFPKDKQIILLRSKEMYPILKYVKSKYGKDFTRMYDKDKPSWMDMEEEYNKDV